MRGRSGRDCSLGPSAPDWEDEVGASVCPPAAQRENCRRTHLSTHQKHFGGLDFVDSSVRSLRELLWRFYRSENAVLSNETDILKCIVLLTCCRFPSDFKNTKQKNLKITIHTVSFQMIQANKKNLFKPSYCKQHTTQSGGRHYFNLCGHGKVNHVVFNNKRSLIFFN